jgi:hypothetical protein
MIARGVSLVLIVSLAVCVGTAFAQQKLGDFVTGGGYDWLLGRWVADGDEGTIELEYKWALDRHIVVTELRTRDLKHRGIIQLDPDLGEIVQVGADSRGGAWKGDWTDEGGDLVYRVEHTGPDGRVNRAEIVHRRLDADRITVALFGVDSRGYRNSEPLSRLTYKRQPAGAAPAASTESSSRYTDYEKLGDLISQGGYEWLAGKWLATENEQKFTLEHTWTLDKHAVLVDVKMGDFTYHGMVMYRPARQEIVQVGADNRGGIWRGTWDEGYEGPTHRIEYIDPDGKTRRMEHVYAKVDADAFRVKEYSQGVSSQPGRTLTFKRQKAAAESK